VLRRGEPAGAVRRRGRRGRRRHPRGIVRAHVRHLADRSRVRLHRDRRPLARERLTGVSARPESGLSRRPSGILVEIPICNGPAALSLELRGESRDNPWPLRCRDQLLAPGQDEWGATDFGLRAQNDASSVSSTDMVGKRESQQASWPTPTTSSSSFLGLEWSTSWQVRDLAALGETDYLNRVGGTFVRARRCPDLERRRLG